MPAGEERLPALFPKPWPFEVSLWLASEHVRISIGPSAGVCCYEVDEPVLDVCVRDFQIGRRWFEQKESGRAHLDLKALVKEQAQAFGVSRSSITTVNVCTICHEDLFFLSAGGEGQRDHGQCHWVAR